MSRGPATFRQSDLRRAVKALLSAGVEVARVEIDRDGRIVMHTGKPQDQVTAETNEWDTP